MKYKKDSDTTKQEWLPLPLLYPYDRSETRLFLPPINTSIFGIPFIGISGKDPAVRDATR